MIARSVNIKIIQLIEAEGSKPWCSKHDVGLGLKIKTLRHVCCLPASEVHGSMPPFLGVREFWWPTLSAFCAGIVAAPAAWSELGDRPTKAFTVLVHSERLK